VAEASSTIATVPKVEITRYASLPLPARVFVVTLSAAGIILFVMYAFAWTFGTWILQDITYFYLLFACFSTCVFLTMPGRMKDRNRLPWYDLVLGAFIFGTMIYFASNTWGIGKVGWVPPPHTYDFVLASILVPVAIESGRRLARWPFVIITVIFVAWALFAEHLPGVLYGPSIPWDEMANTFAYGYNGIRGMPARVIGEILLGFLMLAGMLMATGAGKFFLGLAVALMGRFRGGPAKVAVLASGFFGSLSGVPVANIATTGAFTIPAMKRMGYSTHYAAAIEAVASTGGTIMPPVMGAIAFVVAILADIPYAQIVAGAFIPAILYYWGLVVQVDAYAARVGLRGLPREEIPSLWKTLKGGWQYLLVVAFLIFALLYMRWGAKSPIYTCALLFVLSFTSKETMMTPKRIVETIATIGSLITYMVAIILPIALVMIAMGGTGTLTALTIPIVTMGGESIVLVLIIACVTCYIFGMIGAAMVPYVVLAVCVIPALVAATGLSKLGFHLFIVYYLLTAGITPPICISAFVASGMAGASPYKTGFTAMRLAVVLYFVPFFFLFNPALIAQGPITETLYLFALCLVGIWILASGLEGYLLRVGRLGLWSRPLLVVGGFLIAFPDWMTTGIGAIVTVVVIALILVARKTVIGKPTYSSS